MRELPTTVKGLIDELDRANPHRCPSKEMTDREIWIASGKRELVDTLIARYNYKPGDINLKENLNFVYGKT